MPMTGNTLIITRQFKKPPRSVFAAWADPTAMSKWIGGEDVTAPILTNDFRVGGSYEVCLRPLSGGPDYWWGGKYLEIREPRLISFSVTFYGRADESTRHGAPESRVTVAFEAIETGTRMTFRQEPLPPDYDRAGHEDGWGQAFNKLERSLNQEA